MADTRKPNATIYQRMGASAIASLTGMNYGTAINVATSFQKTEDMELYIDTLTKNDKNVGRTSELVCYPFKDSLKGLEELIKNIYPDTQENEELAQRLARDCATDKQSQEYQKMQEYMKEHSDDKGFKWNLYKATTEAVKVDHETKIRSTLQNKLPTLMRMDQLIPFEASGYNTLQNSARLMEQAAQQITGTYVPDKVIESMHKEQSKEIFKKVEHVDATLSNPSVKYNLIAAIAKETDSASSQLWKNGMANHLTLRTNFIDCTVGFEMNKVMEAIDAKNISIDEKRKEMSNYLQSYEFKDADFQLLKKMSRANITTREDAIRFISNASTAVMIQSNFQKAINNNLQSPLRNEIELRRCDAEDRRLAQSASINFDQYKQLEQSKFLDMIEQMKENATALCQASNIQDGKIFSADIAPGIQVAITNGEFLLTKLDVEPAKMGPTYLMEANEKLQEESKKLLYQYAEHVIKSKGIDISDPQKISKIHDLVDKTIHNTRKEHFIDAHRQHDDRFKNDNRSRDDEQHSQKDVGDGREQ